ncbi:hypothetical protein H0H93_007462 [Arthromyces matolae]|nr:hypothetical protein H0H93_007462 [Arthromyces matolae]
MINPGMFLIALKRSAYRFTRFSSISTTTTLNISSTFLPNNTSGRFYTTERTTRSTKEDTPSDRGNELPNLDSPETERISSAGGITPGFNAPGGAGNAGSVFSITRSPLLDAALTTLIGLGLVFGGGIAYVAWYKKRVLDKIEEAFAAGYDPALELATHQTKRSRPNHDLANGALEFDDQAPWTENMRRKEQDTIDRIVHGEEPGHYFVLLGPKGSGKGTMIYDAMTTCQAEGVSMCEAHPDLEVFRLRLGKTLNFEYNEDSQTAMNKLEKVALRSARRTGRPLVLVINNIHHFKNDDEGQNMILQLQQKAEAWAASGRSASRMHVISIDDLGTTESLHAATRMRMSSERPAIDPDDLRQTISLVGGRLAYLNKVMRYLSTIFPMTR